MATDTFSLSRMTQMHLLLVRQLYDVVVACNVTQYTNVRTCVHVCASVYSVFVIHCQNAVNSRITSGNVDRPEGGMDGLLQAVICQDVSQYLTYTQHVFTYVFS